MSKLGRLLRVGLVVAVVLVLVSAVNSLGGTRDPGRSRQHRHQQLAGPEPPPPSQLPASGSYVHTRVLASGVLDVDQWVRTRVPIRQVTLQADPIIGPGGPPVATFVRIAAGGRVLAAPPAVGIQPQTVRLGQRARLVHVSYLLTGVVVHDESGGSVAAMTSLGLDHTAPPGTLRQSVSGERVRQLLCRPRSAAVAEARHCGRRHGGDWRVWVPGSRHDTQVEARLAQD